MAFKLREYFIDVMCTKGISMDLEDLRVGDPSIDALALKSAQIGSYSALFSQTERDAFERSPLHLACGESFQRHQ